MCQKNQNQFKNIVVNYVHNYVRWGALDRTFQAPYSPGSALSVGNHCFGPRAQVPPLWAKKKCQKGAKSKPATGMAGRDAKGALGTTGAMD